MLSIELARRPDVESSCDLREVLIRLSVIPGHHLAEALDVFARTPLDRNASELRFSHARNRHPVDEYLCV
jgi:hypothetical protein